MSASPEYCYNEQFPATDPALMCLHWITLCFNKSTHYVSTEHLAYFVENITIYAMFDHSAENILYMISGPYGSTLKDGKFSQMQKLNYTIVHKVAII